MSHTRKKTVQIQPINLLVFVLLPILAILIGEMLKTRMIWYIRTTDMIDLLFLSPFYLVMLLFFNHKVFSGQRESNLYLVGLGLMGLTLYGQAMHLTGNTINCFGTEIRNYLDQIPSDMYQLIYFLDEDLGHWIFYAGMFGSLGVWMIADLPDSALPHPGWKVASLAGGLFGLSYAVAIIESSHPWIGFLAAVWLLGCSIWGSRRYGLGWQHRWKQSIWVQFGLAAALMLVIGELAYAGWVGGFIQPSQLGG